VSIFPTWLSEAISLHQAGKPDAALDLVYRHIDTNLWDKSNSPFLLKNLVNLGKRKGDVPAFEPFRTELDGLLGQSSIYDIPLDLLLGIMIVARSAQNSLSNYQAVFDYVNLRLKDEGGRGLNFGQS
jgi:hypothetical protein